MTHAVNESEPRRRRRERVVSTDTRITRVPQPVFKTPAYELVDEEVLEKIHQKSMQILSEGGLAFYHDESVEILKANGIKVDDENIAYFDPDHLMEIVGQAPREFTLLARNPNNNTLISPDVLTFAPVYGPPFTFDLDRGRQAAKLEDLQNFIKLTYMTPWLHHGGGIICEPNDEPVPTRHLDITYSHAKYTDKAFFGSSIGRVPAEDVVKMAEILYGAEAIRENPGLLITINVSSPRRLDDRMLESMIVNAKARQAIMVTPFILSGAMGPVSIAGTVAQLNAEALAGIAFIQLVNPGCPVIYGSFQTTIDLQSGAPVMGAPESQQSSIISRQLARKYNVPFRGNGMYASSKIDDAQGAYESVMAMLPGIFSQGNYVLHAAGWLESGLAAGYEKFILDSEILGMFHKFLEPVDFSDEEFAMESIMAVPPGGHHLGTSFTMERFRNVFYRAEMFDYDSAEQWQERGALTASQRANAKFKQMLNEYEAPTLDPATDEALRDFMARRKREISGK